MWQESVRGKVTDEESQVSEDHGKKNIYIYTHTYILYITYMYNYILYMCVCIYYI